MAGMTARDLAVDPITRQRIRGALTLERDGTIEIRLPHRLESPNKTLHAHWRVRTRDKAEWKARLLTVIADAGGVTSVAAFERPIEALGLPPVNERRIVRIDRQVPSSRNFIRDDDNLVFSAKPLLDRIRALGFVRDDSREWITLTVTQRVSDDRRDWTVIRIEPAPGVSIPFLLRP